MATRTTEVSWFALDSQASQSFIDEFVAAADQSGDLQTDFKKALIAKLGLSGGHYSLDDLWKRYALEVIPSDSEAVGPAKRSPPEHAGQHPKHYLPPGRLRNAGNAKGFPFGTSSSYPVGNFMWWYQTSLPGMDYPLPTTTADIRWHQSGQQNQFAISGLQPHSDLQFPSGSRKVYLELHCNYTTNFLNSNSPPFIVFSRVGQGDDYTSSDTISYQPTYSTTSSIIRVPGGSNDEIAGVHQYLDYADFTVNIAFDIDAQKCWFGKNGTWLGTGTQNPATGDGGFWITNWDASMYVSGADSFSNPLGIYLYTGGITNDTNDFDDWEWRLSEEYWQYTCPTGFGAWPKAEAQVADVSADPAKQEWVPKYGAGTSTTRTEYCHANMIQPQTGLAFHNPDQLTSYDTLYNLNRAYTSGKYYLEFTALDAGSNSAGVGFGVVDSSAYAYTSTTGIGVSADGGASMTAAGLVYSNGSANASPYTSGSYILNRDSRTQGYLCNGDTIMMACDFDNGKVYWGMNGTWFESQDPTNASHGLSMPSGCDSIVYTNDASTFKMRINSGGAPFMYTMPTGYSAASSGGSFIYDMPAPVERDTIQYICEQIGASSTTSIDAPSGITEGDYVFAITWGGNSSSANLTISDGDTWTKLPIYAQITSGDTWYANLWYKVAGASEPSTYTITNNVASAYDCFVAVWAYDADTVHPAASLRSDYFFEDLFNCSNVPQTMSRALQYAGSTGYSFWVNKVDKTWTATGIDSKDSDDTCTLVGQAASSAGTAKGAIYRWARPRDGSTSPGAIFAGGTMEVDAYDGGNTDDWFIATVDFNPVAT